MESCDDASSYLRAAALGTRGSIVAVGDPEARLILLDHQSFTSSLELVDSNGFDHLALTVHQVRDTLLCVTDTLAQLFDLDVVSDVAMRRRLPCPDKGVVLLSEHVDICI